MTLRTNTTAGMAFITAALLAAAAASSAGAAEIHSNGLGGGDWSDPGSWKENVAPGPADDAVISRGDVIEFDRNDDDKISCQQIFIDPKGVLTLKSGAGRIVCSPAGAIEVFGALKLDGSRSAADRLELRLAGATLEQRSVKVMKGGALIVSGRRNLAHGKHNVAISAPAVELKPTVKANLATGAIVAGASSLIDLQRAELVNLGVSITGVDNTGARANERANIVENHFTGMSHLSIASCDSPRIADNLWELVGPPVTLESAIYVILSPLAEIHGNTVRGRYQFGIQGRQQVDSAVTDNTFENCITGVYWYGTNGMLKGLDVRDCDTGVVLTSMSGVMEDVRIVNCKTGYNHAVASAQLNNVVIRDVPKGGVVAAYTSGPLTLLNCNILPEQIQMAPKAPKKVKDGVPAVECLYYLIVAPQGDLPAGTTVEVRTESKTAAATSPAAGPAAGAAADPGVRNSPAPIAANRLTPLPRTLEPLIVKAWTIDDDLRIQAAPRYAVRVLGPAAGPDRPGKVLATTVVTPDASWYRPQPDAPQPTVEIKTP